MENFQEELLALAKVFVAQAAPIVSQQGRLIDRVSDSPASTLRERHMFQTLVHLRCDRGTGKSHWLKQAGDRK